jgi:hypothetical protein
VLLLATTAEEAAQPPSAWLPLGPERRLLRCRQGGPRRPHRARARRPLALSTRSCSSTPSWPPPAPDKSPPRRSGSSISTGRPLFGLHGAAGISDGAEFNPISLVAVPDAVHPGWTERTYRTPPLPSAAAPAPAHWFDHRGPLRRRARAARGFGRAAFSRFLDCGTRLLEAPAFDPIDSPRAPGPVPLSWSSADSGSTYVLEMAALADFRGARDPLPRQRPAYAFHARAEGFYYFRLRAELDGEVSAPAVAVVAVRGSAWDSLVPAEYSAAAYSRSSAR